MAKSASNLTLEGGTHNPFAPPFGFFKRCFVPCLRQMGLEIECSLSRYGFYPAGGGRFKVSINPAHRLNPFILKDKGSLKSVEVLGIVSRIPVRIDREEVRLVCTKLNWAENKGKAIAVDSSGPGNILFAILEYESACQVFTGFGQRGVPLKKVVADVVIQVKKSLQSNAPVEEYLADQLLIPLALAGKGSYCTSGLSRHTLTNIEVIKMFLDIEIDYEKKHENLWQIRIRGDSHGMD